MTKNFVPLSNHEICVTNFNTLSRNIGSELLYLSRKICHQLVSHEISVTNFYVSEEISVTNLYISHEIYHDFICFSRNIYYERLCIPRNSFFMFPTKYVTNFLFSLTNISRTSLPHEISVTNLYVSHTISSTVTSHHQPSFDSSSNI